jgi:hypothetical protein
MRLITHLLIGFATSASLVTARDVITANDQARFIAGLPVAADSPLAPYMSDSGWQQHAADLDQAWARAESRSLSKVRAWSSKFVRSSGSSAPCYYMFSGPDILFARTIYPNASTYVLCGIEPVGTPPDISKLQREEIGISLAGLRRSLSTVLRFSYFITKEMRADLAGSKLGGTLPILYVFLARTGCTIDSVEPVLLSSVGALGSGGVRGVRIVFHEGSGSQTLYYFTADLSNGGSGTAVMNFCRRHGSSGLGLLKAASYLLHENSFSKCRDFLLSSCRVIVQDDSGIPHRYYASPRWQMRYFGQYAGTTGGPFAKYYQSDLAAAYQRVAPVELDFQISYQWNPKVANVQVAVATGNARTKAAQAEPIPVATPVTETERKRKD